MKGKPIIERQINHLNEQQFKKIFPQEYYRKYATHIKILDFEKDLFEHPLSKNKTSLFVSRKRTNSEGLKDNKGTVKLSKYDLVEDTIEKNKMQTVRMQRFVSNLNKKLKLGSSSKSVKNIRSPITGFQALPQDVIEKMKCIQNEQYEAELKKMREKKVKQAEYVHFKKRSYNSTSQLIGSKFMDKSIIADSADSKSIKSYRDNKNHFSNMSNTMQLHPVIILDAETRQKLKINSNDHLTYRERLDNLMQIAKSEIVSINPQDKHHSVKIIMAMNKSIKQINGLKESVSKQKLRMMGAGIGVVLKRTNTLGSILYEQKTKKITDDDLIKMMMRNKGVRDISNNLQILSSYENLIRQKQLQSFLKPIL